jgi:hypothetical protein
MFLVLIATPQEGVGSRWVARWRVFTQEAIPEGPGPENAPATLLAPDRGRLSYPNFLVADMREWFRGLHALGNGVVCCDGPGESGSGLTALGP